MDQNGPFWSILFSRMGKSVWNKVILTKLVILTILDHLGPVRLPPVPQPLLNRSHLRRGKLVQWREGNVRGLLRVATHSCGYIFGVEFGEAAAMKQKSVKRSVFSLNEGKAFSE